MGGQIEERVTSHEPNFEEVLRVLWAGKWRICLWTLITVVVVACATFVPQRTFESHLAIIATGDELPSAVSASGAAALLGLAAGGQTEYLKALLESDTLLIEIIRELQLQTNPLLHPPSFGLLPHLESKSTDLPTIGETVVYLRKRLRVEGPLQPLKGPITVAVQTVSPRLSYQIVTMMLKKLDTRVSENRHSRSAFLRKEVKDAEKSLSIANGHLRKFAESHQIFVATAPETQAELELKYYSSLQAEAVMSEAQLRAVENRMDSSGDLPSQIRLKAEQSGLSASHAVLSHMRDRELKRLQAYPQIAEEAATVIREVQTNQKIFEVVTEQYQLAKLKEEGEQETRPYKVIDPPYIPDEPVTRHGLLKLILAFVVGILLGVTNVVVRYQFRAQRQLSSSAQTA